MEYRDQTIPGDYFFMSCHYNFRIYKQKTMGWKFLRANETHQKNVVCIIIIYCAVVVQGGGKNKKHNFEEK